MSTTIVAQTSATLTEQQTYRDKIAALDLEPIVYKLTHDEDAPGWTLEQTDQYVELYKKFLLLNLLFPSTALPPTKEIDKVWHYHILDTSKYMMDCEQIFGRYFHHFPYFGLRGAQDAQDLADAFEVTRTLFSEHFGIDLTAGVAAEQCRDDCVSISCKGPGDNLQMSTQEYTALLANQERPRPVRV